MTVDEMIKQLQELSVLGYGDYTITFDGGEAIVKSLYVMDEDKCVDVCDYG